MSDANPLTELRAFQRDLLVAMRDSDENHGLGIKSYLEEWYGEVHHGRIYPNFDELLEKGFVEKGEIDQRTNSYELSDKAKEALKADTNWRQE